MLTTCIHITGSIKNIVDGTVRMLSVRAVAQISKLKCLNQNFQIWGFNNLF